MAMAGYAYSLPLGDAFTLSLCGRAAAFLKPDLIEAAYGSSPMGYTLFARQALGQ